MSACWPPQFCLRLTDQLLRKSARPPAPFFPAQQKKEKGISRPAAADGTAHGYSAEDQFACGGISLKATPTTRNPSALSFAVVSIAAAKWLSSRGPVSLS